MNRRSLIRSLVGIAGLIGIPQVIKSRPTSEFAATDHECDAYCFDSAESIARANIEETGEWKLRMHDWSKRRMVFTRCGAAACGVYLASPSHHPYWEYERRLLTPEETVSFQAEFGRRHWLLLSGRKDGASSNIRGFILDGRYDGWNLSVGPRG